MTEHPIALNECQSVGFLTIHKVTPLNVRRQRENAGENFFLLSVEKPTPKRKNMHLRFYLKIHLSNQSESQIGAAADRVVQSSQIKCHRFDLPKMRQEM